MRCFCIGCIEISQRFTIVIKKTKKEVGDIALSRWPPMLAKAKLARDSPSVLGLGVELIKQYGGEVRGAGPPNRDCFLRAGCPS